MLVYQQSASKVTLQYRHTGEQDAPQKERLEVKDNLSLSISEARARGANRIWAVGTEGIGRENPLIGRKIGSN